MSKDNTLFYNKELYFQEIMIMRLKSDYENSNHNRDTLILFNDNIRSFKVFNDLFSAIPQMEIIFEDVNNQELHKLKPDGYTSVRLSLQYKNDGDTTTIIHDFLLDDISVINKKADSTVYELSCVSIWESYRMLNVKYSSKKTKDSIKVVHEILNAADYPVNKKNFKNVTPSGDKIHYIAPMNATLGDCVDEILSYTCNAKTGIYYIWHNLKNDNAEILSVNDTFTNLKIGKYNYLNIPTKDDFEDLNRSVMDLESMNVLKGAENYKVTMPLIFNNFSLKDRKWSKDTYSFRRLKEVNYKLPNADGLFDKIFKHIPKVVYKSDTIHLSYEPLTRGKLRDKIHDLTMYSDVIQFKCTGHLDREIGELMLLTSGNPAMSRRFGGLWLIVRIYHKFEGEQYYNEIIAVRNDELVSQDKRAGTSMSKVPKE